MSVDFDKRLTSLAFCNSVEGLKVIMTSSIRAANEEGEIASYDHHVMWYGGLNLFADTAKIDEAVKSIQKCPWTLEDQCILLREHIEKRVAERQSQSSQ